MRRNKGGERGCYKPYGLFSVCFLFFLPLGVFAQTFSEFHAGQNAAFTQYKNEIDARFARYLATQWRAFVAYKSPALYLAPKPKSVPKTKERPIVNVGPRVVVSVPQNVELPTKKKEKKLNSASTDSKTTFSFFGSQISVEIDPAIRAARFYPANKQGIVAFFNAMATSEYEKILSLTQETRRSLSLNDWGVYVFLGQIARRIYSHNDEVELFRWFFFNKMGYDVRIGIDDRHIVALYKTKQRLYSTSVFTIAKQRYYVLAKNVNDDKRRSVYVYEQPYPNATKPLDLSLRKLPRLQADYKKMRRSFSIVNRRYEIEYLCNVALTRFLKTYPQVDYKVYFQAPMDLRTYASLAKSLKRYINGKKASVAMNFVLRFVQRAWKYRRDDEAFGSEKVMFADEALFYEWADCEDRAILLSRLMRNLFGVEGVAVLYPNHLSTAFAIPLAGDSVEVGSRRYVIADATYVNANIGEAMPQFKTQLPRAFIHFR